MRTPTSRNFMMVAITLTAALTGYGQIVARKPILRPSPTPTPQIPIFRGDRSAAIRRADPRTMGTGVAPAPLSAAEKNTILQTALKDSMFPGKPAANPFAVLTPRTPYVPDRAALHLTDAAFFFTWQNSEVIFSGAGEATVWIYPQKQGQWFMIDCSIEIVWGPGTPARRVTIKSGGNKAETWVKGSGHIQALLVTQSLGWYDISFSASDTSWILYGCEVDAAN